MSYFLCYLCLYVGCKVRSKYLCVYKILLFEVALLVTTDFNRTNTTHVSSKLLLTFKELRNKIIAIRSHNVNCLGSTTCPDCGSAAVANILFNSLWVATPLSDAAPEPVYLYFLGSELQPHQAFTYSESLFSSAKLNLQRTCSIANQPAVLNPLRQSPSTRVIFVCCFLRFFQLEATCCIINTFTMRITTLMSEELKREKSCLIFRHIITIATAIYC